MVSKLAWATAMILIVAVAGVGAWAILGGTPTAGPAWNSVFGTSPTYGSSGIIAIYCVKTTTTLTTDPATWTVDNYYAKIAAEGTLTVPTLTDFYIVVEAIGNKPYVVGNTVDNIKVEFTSAGHAGPENKTGASFSWSEVTGTDNIRVSAAFDSNGGAVDTPFNLAGDTSFNYTAKVFLYY